MNVNVKIFSWDSNYTFDACGWDLKVGDIVIVSFDSTLESAEVVKTDVKIPDSQSVEKIVRKANTSDLETYNKNKEKEETAISFCRKMVKKRGLAMKIVDARFSFDGGKVTFSFIAEKRIDFRDLVRDLSKEFQRSIRLQQIGSRDEAKGKNGFGACGRELCCVKFSGGLKSVTIEDARIQQMGQRGGDRLSGLCGRLRCCLSFESEQYKKNLERFPDERKIVKVGKKKGMVVDRNIMKGSVVVEFEDGSKKTLSLKEIRF